MFYQGIFSYQIGISNYLLCAYKDEEINYLNKSLNGQCYIYLTDIKQVNNKPDIEITPYPSNGKIRIAFKDSNIEKTNLFLYNSIGSIVKHFQKTVLPIEIDLSTFQSGLYFLTIQFNNKTITNKLLIIK